MSYRVSFACLPALLLACPLEALTQDSVYFGAAPLVTDYAALDTSPRTLFPYSYDDKQNGYKLFAGWRMREQFGLELAYADFGKFRSSARPATVVSYTSEAKVRGGSLFAVGAVPVGRFDFFAKAGVVYRERSTVFTEDLLTPCVAFPCPVEPFTATRTPIEDHSTEFAYGAGAELVTFRNIALRAEYERFMFDGGTNVLSIGLTWHMR